MLLRDKSCICLVSELLGWLAAAAFAEFLEQASLVCPLLPHMPHVRCAGIVQSGNIWSDLPQRKHLPCIIFLLLISSLEGGGLLLLPFPLPAAPLGGFLASVFPVFFPREDEDAEAGLFMSANCFLAWSYASTALSNFSMFGFCISRSFSRRALS